MDKTKMINCFYTAINRLDILTNQMNVNANNVQVHRSNNIVIKRAMEALEVLEKENS